MIIEGDLDALIVKPKGLLMQVVATRSVPSGWGDMVSAIFFLGLSGYMSVTIFPLILLFIVTSSFIMLAFAIILDSIAFWFGNTHAISKQIFEFLLTFSNYPKAIYTGMLKFFLLTLIPAGFISFLPIDVIREFSVIAMGEIVLFALFYLWIAKKIFYLGLRRYSSGNKSGFKV